MQRAHNFQANAIRGASHVMGIPTGRLILTAIDRETPVEFLPARDANKVMVWVRTRLYQEEPS
jgi:hypothetical protein